MNTLKQGTWVLRILMAVLFVGVLAYFGVYIWNALTANTVTTTLANYTAEEQVTAQGWFFRDEVLLEQGTELTEVLCSEGEKVGAGDVVARVYSSADGYELQRQLDEAQATLESLQYIQSRTNQASDTEALEDDIVAAITGLRASVAAGDLSDLSGDADELRSLIFRRSYADSGSDSLTAQIEAAQAQVDSLETQASSAYTTVAAPASGLYSAEVDGYEGVLTTAALEGLTPSGLESLAASQGAAAEYALGKVITGVGWYFSCNLTEEQAQNLYDGADVTLRFDDSGRNFSATVTRVSDPENGRVNVTFFSRDYAAQITGLREQEASIVTYSVTGLRVPKRAVRVNQDENLDQVGQLGVYRVSGAQAEWVPVQILWEAEDYYLIAQADKVDEEGNQQTLSDYEQATALREGDTVIVSGEDIYDGKVVLN